MSKTDNKALRSEHNKRVQSGFYRENLGHTCVNCGTTENIEYHHIVPLCVGGTNRLTNISPVCIRCHKAIHGEKDFREYAATKKKPVRINHSFDDDIQKYIDCKIDEETLKGILGIKKQRLSSNKHYKNYLLAHGIKTVINRIDVLIEDCNYPPPKDTEIGRVIYANGKMKSIYS